MSRAVYVVHGVPACRYMTCIQGLWRSVMQAVFENIHSHHYNISWQHSPLVRVPVGPRRPFQA
jgi:hypothetical protein